MKQAGIVLQSLATLMIQQSSYARWSITTVSPSASFLTSTSHTNLNTGIMILTSNRVGTFDEGFKSRIQLSLHYPKLSQKSRRLVWQNFFDRLDNDPVAVAELNIEDLRRNAGALSKFELNGREIRNAINVARPLARSENTRLDFECLEKVIKVQRRFDEYLREVNEGLGDDEVAREDGRR